MLNAKLKKLLREGVAVNCDNIIFKKDGTVAFRRSYYYRHGNTADKFAEAIHKKVQSMGFIASIESSQDRWAPWPRDSYFEVILNVKWN